MMFEAALRVKLDPSNVSSLLRKQVESFRHKRASVKMRRGDDCVVVEIVAEDATAFRAALDSVAKTLKLYEEMREVQ